jgi:hypothetical protein
VNKKQSQSGFAHLAIIIVLVVALLGSLGFVFWQNFMQPKPVDNTPTPAVIDNKKVVSEATIIEPAVVVDSFLKSFLSYMGSSDLGNTDASFAAKSSALTDSYKNSITSPNQGLMYSPIILSQNLPSSFTVVNTSTTSTVSNVTVKLNFTPPLNIIYNLVLIENEWKINGVFKA